MVCEEAERQRDRGMARSALRGGSGAVGRDEGWLTLSVEQDVKEAPDAVTVDCQIFIPPPCSLPSEQRDERRSEAPSSIEQVEQESARRPNQIEWAVLLSPFYAGRCWWNGVRVGGT